MCYPISFSFGMVMMLGYYIFSPKWKEIIRTGLKKIESERAEVA